MAFGEPLMPRYARVAGRLDRGFGRGLWLCRPRGILHPDAARSHPAGGRDGRFDPKSYRRSGYTLAVVVLAVLGWKSAAASSVGFWLVFAAVAIIFYSLRGRFMPKHQGSRAFRLQWMLALGLAPLTLLFFQRPSLISPIANLIEVPWIGLLIGFVVLVTVTLLLLIPSLAMGLLGASNSGLKLLWPELEWLAALPFAQ
jgi:predicted membrane metal-binding protein